MNFGYHYPADKVTLRWPAAIPKGNRLPWKLSKGFCTPWAPDPNCVHRIMMNRQYLIMEVLRGDIVADYGATRLYISAPDAVALSADEMRVEGDGLCRLHVFRDAPLRDWIIHNELDFHRRALKEGEGTPPGIFDIGMSLMACPCLGIMRRVVAGDPGRGLFLAHVMGPGRDEFGRFLASGPMAGDLAGGLPDRDPNWIDPHDVVEQMLEAEKNPKVYEFGWDKAK
jgi:hypothetical protein